MATTTLSPKSTKHYNVRSISLPAARSHPTTLKLEQELNKLESYWEISSSPLLSSSTKAEKILSAVTGLGELYKCIGDLLALPLTQQVLAHQHYRHEDWVNQQLLDGLLRYLDVCGNTRDAILSMKESVRELESAFRRSKCTGVELSIEGNVTAYISSRKRMKKEIVNIIKNNLAPLKEIKDLVICSDSDQNNHLSSVIKMLRRSSLITTWIFQSLLSFLSATTTTTPPMSSSSSSSSSSSNTKWSLISKLFHYKKVESGGNSHLLEENEIEIVDIALSELLLLHHHQQRQQPSSKLAGSASLQEEEEADQKISNESAINVKLEALDGTIGGFEDALESLFRRLIHARVSLLNIISH
ncbi:hypothetical protein ACOSP7_022568 [Xanthoceras sorbifolium]